VGEGVAAGGDRERMIADLRALVQIPSALNPALEADEARRNGGETDPLMTAALELIGIT